VLVLLEIEVPEDHKSDSVLVYDLTELELDVLRATDCEYDGGWLLSIRGPLILLMRGRRELTDGTDELIEDTVLLLVLLTGAAAVLAAIALTCKLAVEELLDPKSLPIVGILLGLDNDLGLPSCCFLAITLLIVEYFS
jgi:hypothetical protein